MAKTIDIGGRLHSTATGNVALGANEVYDDDKGKKQSEINVEIHNYVENINNALENLNPEQQEALEIAEKANNNEAKLGYYVCDTESNIAAKVISNATGYVLSNGGSIKVKMTNANSASNNTLNINSTGAKPLYYDGERASVNNTWEEGETLDVYYNGTNYYANNVASSSSNGVLNVSVKYPTNGIEGGNTYTLEGALSVLDSNLPSNKKKGGMSIKFVHTSDNKYIQYRLTADDWSINTEDWVIADEGVYVDNPEFIYVQTDNEKKILFGFTVDGEPYFGVGCPKQVKDYIEEKIAELSLNEYDDIVAFLSDYLGSDTTLKAMIDGINDSISNLSNTKIDKVEGKSLIDAEYASTKSTIDNPEFLDAVLDAEGKLLEGTQEDGSKLIGGDLNVGGSANISGNIKVLGIMEVSGVLYKVIENLEYLAAWVDAEGKVLFGFKTNGKTYVGDADFLNEIKYNQEAITEIKTTLATIGAKVDSLDIDALASITAIDNPEYIEANTDSEGKILAGRTPDGAAFEKVGFSTPKLSIEGHTIKNIEDSEGRSEITTDSEDKVISYRDNDGVLHENVGIETDTATINHLNLTDNGIDELGKVLKDGGYANLMDWSDKDFIEIPIPLVCAIVNFGVNSQVPSKPGRKGFIPGVNGEIPTFIEFWDKNGNYFKKPILLSAQGSSSMDYWIKNQGFDIDDGSSIKFGKWVAQDSFHIKKYYIDVFRGQCIVGYWLTEQIYQTRHYGERRPWDYLNQGGNTVGAIGKFKEDYDTGALAHPDGFPVHVFFNGKDAGIYTFNLKKHRDNYYASKNNAKNIILDGNTGYDELFGGTIDWTKFEIRNPKSLKLVDGSKYDGDNPQEITGDSNVDATSAEVKGYIERLAGAYSAINANKTKVEFEKYFNVPFFIDYFLVSQVIWNQDGFNRNWIWCTWDGQKWTPTSYDMDSIFGMYWTGTKVVPAGTYQLPKANVAAWTNTNILVGSNEHIVSQLWDLYSTEIKSRYKELRDNGILTTDNIIALLERWVNNIGYDNLKNDIENVCSFNGVPQTPSYRNGANTYEKYPENGGFYNSILRVKRWLDEHFTYLDSADILNYNQN